MKAMPPAVFCGICGEGGDQSSTTRDTPVRLEPAAGGALREMRSAQGKSRERDLPVEAEEAVTCSMPSGPSATCGPEALARKLVEETLTSGTPLTATIRSEGRFVQVLQKT